MVGQWAVAVCPWVAVVHQSDLDDPRRTLAASMQCNTDSYVRGVGNRSCVVAHRGKGVGVRGRGVVVGQWVVVVGHWVVVVRGWDIKEPGIPY